MFTILNCKGNYYFCEISLTSLQINAIFYTMSHFLAKNFWLLTTTLLVIVLLIMKTSRYFSILTMIKKVFSASRFESFISPLLPIISSKSIWSRSQSFLLLVLKVFLELSLRITWFTWLGTEKNVFKVFSPKFQIKKKEKFEQFHWSILGLNLLLNMMKTIFQSFLHGKLFYHSKTQREKKITLIKIVISGANYAQSVRYTQKDIQ